jgi:hypothetical protein
MVVTSEMKMACRGEIHAGARCRKMVQGAGCCDLHQSAKLADPPTVVLFKTRVNQKWTERLERTAVRWQNRDDARLRAEHEAEAAGLGRSATAIRPTPDSGSPVFGGEGASNCSLRALFEELKKVGYALVDIHLYKREHEGNGMANLTIEFRRDKVWPPMHPSQATRAVIHDLLNANWEHVHVWANPRKPDGSVPHTVNASHRQPAGRSQFNLVFDDGYWNLQEAS